MLSPDSAVSMPRIKTLATQCSGRAKEENLKEKLKNK